MCLWHRGKRWQFKRPLTSPPLNKSPGSPPPNLTAPFLSKWHYFCFCCTGHNVGLILKSSPLMSHRHCINSIFECRLNLQNISWIRTLFTNSTNTTPVQAPTTSHLESGNSHLTGHPASVYSPLSSQMTLNKDITPHCYPIQTAPPMASHQA